MQVWKLTITLKTDFNTAFMRRGSTIWPLKDEKFVYIPGTHIKGVVKCELERMGVPKTTIERLFGKKNQDEVAYEEPKLKFFDAVVLKSEVPDYERTHVSIDVRTMSHSERALFTYKLIPAGTKFTGFICVRGELSQEEEKILLGGILSAAHYGFGNSRSRGLGSVEIKMEKSTVEEIKEVYLQ